MKLNIFFIILFLSIVNTTNLKATCQEISSIVNGDFNSAGDGWATGWSVNGGLNPSSSYNAHGQYVFLWDSSTISQTISVEKNTNYQIKFMGAYSVKKNGTSDPNDNTYKGQMVKFTFSNGKEIKQEVKHWIYDDNSLHTYTVNLGNSDSSTHLTIKACAGGCSGASDSFIKIDYFKLYKCTSESEGGGTPPPPPLTSITKKIKLTIYNDDIKFLAKDNSSTKLHTKIVNQNFSLNIHSIDENKNDKKNTIAKNVKVRLIPSSQSCSSSSQGFTSWIDLALENKKQASALFNSSNVHKNLKVQVTWKDVRNKTKIECCSVDNFAIRPDRFVIELSNKDLTHPLKAEELINMKVKAVDESGNIVSSYTNFPIIETIKDDKYSGDQKPHGLDISSYKIINGFISKNKSYDEAGKLTIEVKEKPPYFADVDKYDSPSTYKITPATHQVRVIPDHFDISYTMQDKNPTNKLTFISNNLASMSSSLAYTITAKGVSNRTLTRYTKNKYSDDIDVNIKNSTTTDDIRSLTLKYKNSKVDSSKNFNSTSDTTLNISYLQSDFKNGVISDTLYENFARDPKVAQNPILLTTKQIDAKEKNGVASIKVSGTKSDSSQKANFYYGREHAPSPQTSTTKSMLAKVYYEVYCKNCTKSTFVKAKGQASIDSIYWYILPSTTVNNFSPACDFNSPRALDTHATTSRVDKFDINVTAPTLPHANKIYYTPNQTYLQYDKFGSLLPEHYFDVKFTTSNTQWAGEGDKGKTVDTTISKKSNQSLDW